MDVFWGEDGVNDTDKSGEGTGWMGEREMWPLMGAFERSKNLPNVTQTPTHVTSNSGVVETGDGTKTGHIQVAKALERNKNVAL